MVGTVNQEFSSWIRKKEQSVGMRIKKKFITRYYKNLFGPSKSSAAVLDETRLDDIAQVSPQENEILVAPFSDTEIRETVFQMEHNKILLPKVGYASQIQQY